MKFNYIERLTLGPKLASFTITQLVFVECKACDMNSPQIEIRSMSDCLCRQESKVSKAVKSVVTLSTLLLCCLIVIYHAIEVQVAACIVVVVVVVIIVVFIDRNEKASRENKKRKTLLSNCKNTANTYKKYNLTR